MNLLNTLSALISTPSVNPMGRNVQGPEYLESRMTDLLEGLFQGLGLPTKRQTVAPQRDNIIARLDADPAGPAAERLLLLEVHQDTVPVDGMTVEPFSPIVRDGRIYGRGSCDVKGGMAAMLLALARLAQDRPAGMPTVVMACTVNEEFGFTGANALTGLWSDKISDPFIPRRPDACVVAEPTELQTVVSHNGVVRWRCHTSGRAAHSSNPQLGDNAIYRMSHVLRHLETYAKDIAPTLGNHALCGKPTLSVGMITGGISVNTVPESCTIEIDRRLIPGESPLDARRHVIESFPMRDGPAVQHDDPYIVSAGLGDESNRRIAQGLIGAAGRCGYQTGAIGVPYGTDAAAIAASGVPTVVFGPGSINQAHTADEWIEIQQVQAASDILVELATAGAW